MDAEVVKAGEEFISHFGVKGMHWGVRKASSVSTETHIDTGLVKRQTKVTATGGESHPAHADAIKAAEHQQRLKKSGAAALSNKELRDLITRRQLEDQVHAVTTRKGKRYAKKQLEVAGQQQVQRGLGAAAAKGAVKVGTVFA